MNGYMPLQPEFNCFATYMEQREQFATDNSRVPLLCYEFLTDETFSKPITAIPDGCIDILISCTQKPEAYLYGSVLQRIPLDLLPNTKYFGVRFFPHHLKRTNLSIQELTSNRVPLHDFSKIDFYCIEKIADQGTFADKRELFLREIGERIFSPTPSHLIRYALERIAETKGNISIKDLGLEVNYSSRYLRLLFEEYVGLPPKLFSQITRFQYALQDLLHHRRKENLWDNGYYDQAHFIREFKKFGSLSPKLFLESL